MQILAAQQRVLSKSLAGKAASYTLRLWKKLTLFLEYPELELSTNLAENSMRPIAIGRRNWIHLGSQEAGPKVAAIFSIVESCRRPACPSVPISPMSCQDSPTAPSRALPSSLPPPTPTTRSSNLLPHSTPRQPCAWSDAYDRTIQTDSLLSG